MEQRTPTKQGGQPSRIGKRVIAGHFDQKVAKALKVLAAQEDTTVQLLLAKAINDLTEKKGLGRLADETPQPRGLAARKK
jgi:hypothetical protein